MKYAVIAALLATSTQALTGCHKGIGAKVYSDSKCKEETTATHTMLEEDLEKTNKCVTYTATKEDKAALKFSQKTLEDKTAVSNKALKSFQKSSALDVRNSADTDDVSVDEKYSKDYAAIKTAYVTKEKSVAVVKAYTEENPSSVTDVKKYAEEYMKLWKLQDVPEDDQKATDITDQKKVVAPLEEKLPKNLDVKLVQQAVKDKKAFEDLMEKVDGAD